MTIPVDHFSVDFRTVIIYNKLQQIRAGEEIMEGFNDFDLSDLILRINEKYNHDIEKFSSVMSIIDSQWAKTWWFFLIQNVLFTFGYFFPFLLQLFFVYDDPE